MSGRTHKAAVLKKAQGRMEIVDKETPKPKAGEVLIKVSVSSICASDHFTVQGVMGSPYPLSAGHEVVGTIAELGDDVSSNWKVGQRVGLGWNGGYCHKCEQCRKGDFIHCDAHLVTGVSIDGGHQEYVIARESAVVNLPQDQKVSDAELAPLLCAGNTVYEALINSGMQAGDVVVVQALGGLGHLAVQIAAKAGATVVVVSRSDDKKELALKLGAHHFFSAKDNAAEELKKIGPVKFALATAPGGSAPADLIPLLGIRGTLICVGVPMDGKAFEVSSMDLVQRYLRIQGAKCGAAASNDTFTHWASANGIKSMVQEWPLEKAHEAYEDTMKGNPRFRNVIVMNK